MHVCVDCSPLEVLATCDISSDTEKIHQFHFLLHKHTHADTRAHTYTQTHSIPPAPLQKKKNPGLLFQFDEYFIWVFYSKVISEKNCVFVTDCCREEGNESDLCGVGPEDSLFKDGSLLPDVEPWDESVYVHFTCICFCVCVCVCVSVLMYLFAFMCFCVCSPQYCTACVSVSAFQ